MVLSGSISNDGFMVKRSGSIGNLDSNTDEGSTKLLRFIVFSSDTHTKYPPTLETFGMTLVGIVVPFHH